MLADNGASPERYLDQLNTLRRRGKRNRSGTRDVLSRFRNHLGLHWRILGRRGFQHAVSLLEGREAFDPGELIVHWPAGLKADPGSIHDEMGHVIDLLPTLLDLADVPYPAEFSGHRLKPLEGHSLAPMFDGKPIDGHPALFFEHEGGRAVRNRHWKLVAPRGGTWEIYHISTDAAGRRTLRRRSPMVAELSRMWREWAERWGLRREGLEEIVMDLNLPARVVQLSVSSGVSVRTSFGPRLDSKTTLA